MDGDSRFRPASALTRPASRWDRRKARTFSEAELLVYRSNLLGSDRSVTNFGGGNTSAKIKTSDPITGEPTDVLWVKASGGDLGSITPAGFARLRLDRLRALERSFEGSVDEARIAGLYAHAAFEPASPAPSIDTPLHGLLTFAHIDHVHPDAVLALAACSNGPAAAREVFEGRVGWTEWLRPGFELALRLRALVEADPGLRGVVLAGHGLISWGETAEACFRNTLDITARATDFLNERLARRTAFGGRAYITADRAARAAQASRLGPELRALAGDRPRKILHFDDSAETLEFVSSQHAARLTEAGSACPDHFLRTKMRPLLLDPDLLEEGGAAYLAEAFSTYRTRYETYYRHMAGPESPAMRDASPVVVLHPRLGMFTLASTKPAARIAGEFYRNTINFMRGAESIGAYQGLNEVEAFGIEYWALEEAKLRRQPPLSPLAGRIALITGGGGGIGRAIADRLLADGACVVLADLNRAAARDAADELERRHGPDRVRTAIADVTSEAQVAEAVACAAREYGGLDILIANAGIASSAPLEQTTRELWRKNHAVLAEGYFLAARESFPLLKAFGGSIVFVGSKNALAASVNAAAYASAKAAAV
ncbi:MAG: bifunctional rhamnulose-1-phosphate aldolase/short-chain dehydrogenase, partial [Caulobacteraceae bacterium]